MTTTLEHLAREAWHRWAEYRQHGICACCNEPKYVGRRRPSGRWLCLDCFDQGER